MKITFLSPHGYCSGVDRAIKYALDIKSQYQDKEVYILGMLVHNEAVTEYLFNHGIKTLYKKGEPLENLINSIPEGQIVIFTAHGHPEYLDELCLKRHLSLFDAVCPKVKSNLQLIKKEVSNGHEIIFIGYLNHPETNAAITLSDKIHLFDVEKGFINKDNISDPSPLVVNQTTLNYEELKDIHQNIIRDYPEARLLNEVCPTTRLRQEALRNIDNDVDTIIVVGDPKSSNTNRLYEIATSLYKDKLVLKIANKDELDISLLKNKKHIAISSGASTPDSISNDVVSLLNSLD